jgi:hypothetical protein
VSFLDFGKKFDSNLKRIYKFLYNIQYKLRKRKTANGQIIIHQIFSKFVKKLFNKYNWRLEKLKGYLSLIDYRQSELNFYVEFGVFK